MINDATLKALFPMNNHQRETNIITPARNKLIIALGLISIGVAIGAAGIYIGDTDDAPGAALIGVLLMIGAVALGVRTARRKP